MNIKQLAIFEAVIGLSGFALFWHATNWMAALGLFMCLYANNIGHSNRA